MIIQVKDLTLLFILEEYRTKYELMYEAFYIANLFFLMNKTNWKANDDEYYVLSAAWFEKWKSYTNYDYFMIKTASVINVPRADDKTFFANSEQFVIEEVQKYFEKTYLTANTALYPGVISNNLLLFDHNLCAGDNIVRETSSSYSYYNIKENVLEGKDFIVVSKEIWGFLSDLYGGIEIKRYRINLAPNVNVVETKLKSILVTTTRIKQGKLEKPRFAFQSRGKTVREFKKHLIKLFPFTQDRDETLNSSKNFRLWSLDSSVSIEGFEHYLISSLKKVSLNNHFRMTMSIARILFFLDYTWTNLSILLLERLKNSLLIVFWYWSIRSPLLVITTQTLNSFSSFKR